MKIDSIPVCVLRPMFFSRVTVDEIFLYTTICNKPMKRQKLTEHAEIPAVTVKRGLNNLKIMGLIHELDGVLFPTKRIDGFMPVDPLYAGMCKTGMITGGQLKLLYLIQYLLDDKSKIHTTPDELAQRTGLKRSSVQKYLKELSLLFDVTYRHINGQCMEIHANLRKEGGGDGSKTTKRRSKGQKSGVHAGLSKAQ